VQLVRKTGRTSASAFLEALIAAVPYKIHTVLTDNGVQFTFPPPYADGPTARYTTHMFDMRCQENGIEHRLTKIKHPWTNGQVERMNRTIKEATVQRYHYDRHDQLETHLADFINAYNYARRLKTLKGLTPYEYICTCWTSQPQRFKLNPLQKMPGPNMFVEGVLWIVRTGSPWRDLPEAFGDWNSVFRRFSRWSIKGVWWRIFEAMSDDPDFEYLIVDSTIVPAHQHAAGAKKGGLKIGRSAARAVA
jgi:transposase